MIYAATRIRQAMNALVSQVIHPLVENCDATEQVERWFEDEASKHAYRKELVFMQLRKLLRNDAQAVTYAGNLSFAQWQAALDKAAEMLQRGELPTLEYPPSPEWMIPYLYACTFVLEQYRYGDDVRVHPGDVVLDCGACGGETALWAMREGAKLVYAFEPSPITMPYLRKNIECNGGSDCIIPVELGLGDSAGWLGLAFSDEGAGSTKLVKGDSNAEKVRVDTLDNWCAVNSVKPNFIKMDMEGAEVGAILGAQRIIAENKPQLAISLYHNLSDMWTIPLLIKEICPKYRFWCRKNSLYVEFILYASVSRP